MSEAHAILGRNIAAVMAERDKRIAELEAQLDELWKQKPFGYWHVAEDEDECEFRLGADISGDCPDCLPLYAAPIPPASQWQPIETAPKEGLIDLWDGNKVWSRCHWDEICQEWRHITMTNHLVSLHRTTATRWMPLPIPPEGSKP